MHRLGGVAQRQLEHLIEVAVMHIALPAHRNQGAAHHAVEIGIEVGVFEQAAVLLGLLMLRGPQTAAELRLNSERWYKFADISSVEGFLEELQERTPAKGGPLVVKLARAAGAREPRWAHLLCGPVDATQPFHAGASASGHGQERLERLESEVALLRATVEKLCSELGLSPPVQQ